MTTTAKPGPAAPISFADVERARDRISDFLERTPVRDYPLLNARIPGASVFVKHENMQPTGSFKVRNGVSAMTGLTDAGRKLGIIGASTGNHGLGLAFAGRETKTPVTICVPSGCNPEKIAGMRAYNANVVEEGRDYDDALANCLKLASERGLTLVHSTNDANIIAGAATMSLELLEQQSKLDVLFIAIGGGSQAVGAITVARALNPGLKVIGVQAAGAATGYESWRAREPKHGTTVNTFAEGVATRSTYAMTFPALLDGLSDFVTVTDAEIAEAVRIIISTTHNLVEGAGAMGVAAAMKMKDQLAGRNVGVIFCGANMDSAVLRRILSNEL